MNKNDYKELFFEGTETKNNNSKANRALAYAMDIRKFEIELYWKRATYFWTLIAAVFAAYALAYNTEHTGKNGDIFLSLLFSILGFIFSFSWYLVNRGSKFWQNNWERHVDLLEEIASGPLYKIIACDEDKKGGVEKILISPEEFSVTKINQMLSLFVVFIWLFLIINSTLPLDLSLPLNPFKTLLLSTAFIFTILLYVYGGSSNETTSIRLRRRSLEVIDE